MWDLQTDVLLRLLLACGAMIIISGVSRLLFKKDFGPKVLVIASLAVIAYVSWQLALFSAGYTLVTFLLARVLKRLDKSRRLCFVLFSFLCAVPFLYGRMTEFFPQLPLIISFVGIAYHMLKAIDAMYFVYYADMDIEFLPYINYILFFPTFTSGPIFRYRDFLRIFNKPVPLTADRFIMYVKRFIKGMFKKMVVLYFINAVFVFLLDLDMNFYVSFIVTVLSYFIMFFDLSGYSDIAIAVGSVMGYTVPENFRKPWAAASFTQFWRNWHITLSDWVREHIFVVLNNRRLGRWASAGMGFMVMFVMEMWHGFAPINLIGGVYNGLILGLENLFGLTTADKRKMKKPVYIFRCFAVNFLFALNTLLYSVSADKLFEILRGFARI